MSESIRAIQPYVEINADSLMSESDRPTLRAWMVHSLLFFVTLLTTTFAGILNAAPEIPVPQPPLTTAVDYLFYVPIYYSRTIGALFHFAILNPHFLTAGLTFSATLLAILTAHEMGHYLACRRYSVNATLPFFIPAPPLFLAGTFGAFIKIKSPIPTRQALFDIGLAGPLAGFVALIPVAVIGVLNIGPPLAATGHEIIFNDPPFLRLIAWTLRVQLDPHSPTNPSYMAAWIGLLVTSLNLMPVGQLDGGHGVFAFFGQPGHKFIGRVAFVVMVVIGVLGFVWHGSPSGFVYILLLAIMLKVRHPQPQEMEPLGRKRLLVGAITVLVFALSFWPFPITIT